jgi:hypothetical protein
MGEILGIGLSHYPLLSGPDEAMAGLLRWTLADPDLPAAWRQPDAWPVGMREEWGADDGTSAAATHRAALVESFGHLRSLLDEFNPDAVVVFGDDQYENFKDDLIPPVAVLAYGDIDVRPWHPDEAPKGPLSAQNVWGEGPGTVRRVRGRPDIGRYLASALLEQDIDVAYGYRPLHHPGLAHAFLNTVLFLDYHRSGFEYPVIPVAVNCYGRRVVSYRGTVSRLGDERPLDPPSPSPARMIAIGAATGRALAASPWRLALVASSSWSHAFLCDRMFRLRPDRDADERLYRWLVTDETARWSDVTLADLEAAGQHEVLNWFALVGAMRALDRPLLWSRFVETQIFNSNKVFAAFEPGP